MKPVYPEDARKEGLSGRVFVRFRIGTDEKVDSVHFLKGSPVFRDAAIEAIRRFEFEPATANGKPVSVWLSQAVKFDLSGGKTSQKLPGITARSIPRNLMDVLLLPDGQILLLGSSRSGLVSADEMMDYLRKRMSGQKQRIVTVNAHSTLSGTLLQELMVRAV